jgi:hypothetical protein
LACAYGLCHRPIPSSQLATATNALLLHCYPHCRAAPRGICAALRTSEGTLEGEEEGAGVGAPARGPVATGRMAMGATSISSRVRGTAVGLAIEAGISWWMHWDNKGGRPWAARERLPGEAGSREQPLSQQQRSGKTLNLSALCTGCRCWLTHSLLLSLAQSHG